MKRGVLSVITGLVVWVGITILVGFVMRAAWTEYAAVADAMRFTLPMMLARLLIGAVATVAAGWVTAGIAKRSVLASAITGVILLAAFIPQHISLWNTFPIWYHATFLCSLIPLSYLGGTIAARSLAVVGRSEVLQVAGQPSTRGQQ
jgi:hypothetical protein